MNEDKASRYHRLRRRADAASVLAEATVLVLLILTGSSSRLASDAAALASRLGLPPWLHSSFAASWVVAVAWVLCAASELPFALFGGFLVERRYGLTGESIGAWLRLHAKAGLLGLGVVLAAANLVVASMRLWPGGWWLPVSAAAGVALLAFMVAWPVIVLPLFDPVEPLAGGTLAARLSKLLGRAGLGPMELFCWRLGARSRKAQAVLAGLGSTRRVLLSDTLLERYRDDEIEVVVAHELGHHARGDTWWTIAFEVIVIAGSLAVADLVLRAWAGPFGLVNWRDPAALPLLALALGACGLAAGPVGNAMSRAFERRADRFALDLTANPEAFVRAMRRLAEQNLADPAPPPLVRALWMTHPPIAQRIAQADAWRG